VRIWDARSGAALLQLIGHAGFVHSCAFAPDGARVVSASADGTVRVWDAHSGEELLQLIGHAGSVQSCAFAPDGRRAVSAGADGTMRVWDVHTGEELLRCLATRSGTATLNLQTNQVVELAGDAWRHVAWQVWDETHGWMPVPIETFGIPPEPRRLKTVSPPKA
jgi:WD40 repeat protein